MTQELVSFTIAVELVRESIFNRSIETEQKQGRTVSTGEQARNTMASNDKTAHSEVTLALAKKEHAEHMDGMAELKAHMKTKPIKIKAYKLDDPNAPPDAKTVTFVRHGQGFHNLLADLAKAAGKEWQQFTDDPNNPYRTPEILDAPLTDKGRQQALQLQPKVAALPHPPQLVLFSPNCRALQTGLLVFEQLKNVPFVAHEWVREETGIHCCDQRRPTSRQAAEFPRIDFSLLSHEDDPIYRDDHRETKLQVGERIYEFLVDYLSNRPESHVAINSHSGWLLTVFNGVVQECHDDLKAWWQTGEMRTCKLEFIRA